MEFIKVDVKEYVKQFLESGVKPKQYYKQAVVGVRQGVLGEEVKTIMKHELLETTNIVKKDEKTGKVDVIIKNPNGEEYIIRYQTLLEKYNFVENKDTLSEKEFKKFSSKRVNVLAVQIKDDITFIAPWGSEMNIEKGGFLVISKPDEIYGIRQEEFLQTYRLCEKEKILI